MHIDMRSPEECVGTIVYKSFNPKTLYIIDSIKQVNQFDITVVIKDSNGKHEAMSSLRLKDFKKLVDETETKLKNHQARLWNFQTKLNLKTD